MEPTLANMKRMELKNQRRGIEESIVSSSINNVINGRPTAIDKSNRGDLVSERSFGNLSKAGRGGMQPNAKGVQFKFGTSMRHQMFGFGSGIGLMMKSMD